MYSNNGHRNSDDSYQNFDLPHKRTERSFRSPSPMPQTARGQNRNFSNYPGKGNYGRFESSQYSRGNDRGNFNNYSNHLNYDSRNNYRNYGNYGNGGNTGNYRNNENYGSQRNYGHPNNNYNNYGNNQGHNQMNGRRNPGFLNRDDSQRHYEERTVQRNGVEGDRNGKSLRIEDERFETSKTQKTEAPVWVQRLVYSELSRKEMISLMESLIST